MGIYSDRTFTPNPDGTITETYKEPGLVRTRVLRPDPWVEERTDCYCCSCPEHGSDPACRNHGFAAQRPCEAHNMPGQRWDDGSMPASVQKWRKHNEILEAGGRVR